MLHFRAAGCRPLTLRPQDSLAGWALFVTEILLVKCTHVRFSSELNYVEKEWNMGICFAGTEWSRGGTILKTAHEDSLIVM